MGPGIVIWLEKQISFEALIKYKEKFKCYSSQIEKTKPGLYFTMQMDKWLSSKGLDLYFDISLYHTNYKRYVWDYEPEILQLVLGFLPEQEFVISALSKDTDSYLILHELALYTSKTFNGIVDLECISEDLLKTIKGKVYQIPYDTAPEMPLGESSFGDFEFFRNWCIYHNLNISPEIHMK